MESTENYPVTPMDIDQQDPALVGASSEVEPDTTVTEHRWMFPTLYLNTTHHPAIRMHHHLQR